MGKALLCQIEFEVVALGLNFAFLRQLQTHD